MFKISDIHYEVDMALLGCNSKLLWHDVYSQITDAISAKADKVGVILCKNFHEIHSELLENFYSYMQDNQPMNISVKYVLISEEISFLPDNVIRCCQVISVPRPSKAACKKCVPQIDLPCSNMKSGELVAPHKIICDKILRAFEHTDDVQFLTFRDDLYDIFIFNLDVTECIWYILTRLTERFPRVQQEMSTILLKTHSFLKFYNNNYRPIYHLENYLYSLIIVAHGYPDRMLPAGSAGK